MAPHNCYKALGDDDKWVSIAVGTENEWRALCGVIGQPALAEDPRFSDAAARKQNEDALDEIITDWTQHARSMGNHPRTAARRRRGVPRDEQQGPRRPTSI